MTAAKPTDVYFDEILRSWITSYARSQRWRIAGWYSVKDLIQDGYICYCKCRDAYTLGEPDPTAVHDLNTNTPNKSQRRHFMALVQTAFKNHIHTLSTRYMVNREEPIDCPSSMDSVTMLEDMAPPQLEETSVLMALASAPAEIGEAIGKLISDGLDGEQYLRTRLRRQIVITKHSTGGVSTSIRVTRGRRALRETTTEYFQRVLGDGDILRKTGAYIHS
jgi:hypothetical protein